MPVLDVPAQNDPKDYDPILHKNEARPYENTRTRNSYFDEILKKVNEKLRRVKMIRKEVVSTLKNQLP